MPGATPIIPATPPTADTDGGLASASMSRLSGQLLRLSWLNILPSFGLTLIYINIHFLGRYFAHSPWFASFGSEWRAVPVGGPSTTSALEFGEIIALALCDAIISTVIVGAAIAIAFLAQATLHPCEFLAAVGPSVAALFGPLTATGAIACTAIVG